MVLGMQYVMAHGLLRAIWTSVADLKVHIRIVHAINPGLQFLCGDDMFTHYVK